MRIGGGDLNPNWEACARQPMPEVTRSFAPALVVPAQWCLASLIVESNHAHQVHET
jgi:hypothetical protein